MTALYIILGILAFFVLLFSIPIHIVLRADTDVQVYARVLFFKYALFPMKKRKKKKKPVEKQKKDTPPKKKAKKPDAPKPKKKMRDIISLVKLILKLVGAVLRKFPKHFGVRVLQYEISVATGDAAKTAIVYGVVTGLSANLFELLRKGTRFRIKRGAPVNVYTNFLGEKTEARIALDISLTLWGILSMLIAAGLAFVKAKVSQTPEQKEEETKSSPETAEPTTSEK